MTVVDLLWDHARAAKGIVKNYVPRMTKEDYLGLLRGLFRETSFAAT